MWGLPEHGNLCKHKSSSTTWVFPGLQLIFHTVTVFAPSQTHAICQETLLFNTMNLAASYSYRQLYQWRLLPLCPQTPGVTVTAECLLQVTDRAPGHQWPSGRQGKALYPKGQCVIVLMWFLWYFVFQHKPNHISTDCHVQTCKLQMHRSLTAVLLSYYVFLTNIITFYKSLVHLPNSGSHASLRIFHFPVVSSVINYQQHF